MYVIITILKLLLVVVNWIANHTLRLLKVEPKEEVASDFTAEEVAGFIAESKREGLLDKEAHTLLSEALAIGADTIESIIVPEADLVTAPIDATVGALAAMQPGHHPRRPRHRHHRPRARGGHARRHRHPPDRRTRQTVSRRDAQKARTTTAVR